MKSLILGAYGQDGTYLARHLVSLGFPVLATSHTSDFPEGYPEDVEHRLLDVANGAAFKRLVEEFEPDAIFNLAAMSSVAQCWRNPEAALRVNGTAVYEMLDRTREYEAASGKSVRFIQAGSSEMYGGSREPFVHEDSLPSPVSPYGLAKSLAHEAIRIHRRAYGSHRSNVTMYNHESPLRPRTYLSRHVSSGVANIAAGKASYLTIESLDVSRDWGHAEEYMQGLIRVAQLPSPSDFVFATGMQVTLEDLLRVAFNEIGVDDWRPFVINGSKTRPLEPKPPQADPSRTWQRLGWRPAKKGPEVMREMVRHDLARAADHPVS